jgi:hypothetical protein
MKEMGLDTEASKKAKERIQRLNQQVESNFLDGLSELSRSPHPYSAERLKQLGGLELSYLLGEMDNNLHDEDSIDDSNHYAELAQKRESEPYLRWDGARPFSNGNTGELLGSARILKAIRQMIKERSEQEAPQQSPGRIVLHYEMPAQVANGVGSRDYFGLRSNPARPYSLIGVALGIDSGHPDIVVDAGNDEQTETFLSNIPGLSMQKIVKHPGDDETSRAHRIESVSLVFDDVEKPENN